MVSRSTPEGRKHHISKTAIRSRHDDGIKRRKRSTTASRISAPECDSFAFVCDRCCRLLRRPVRSSSSPSAAGGSKRRSTSSCLLCCALAAPQEASMILQGAREELANEGGLNTSRAAGVIDKSIATRQSPPLSSPSPSEFVFSG